MSTESDFTFRTVPDVSHDKESDTKPKVVKRKREEDL